MNPLTQVKRIQKLNSTEAALGISDDASWHAKYSHSAYVFVGGIPFDLTEGDLLAVFAQYGEVVDVNLVRDKATGKSRGFAFLAYEDQRSTILAVDNLNGAKLLSRIIRVDHVTNYKKKEEEEEDEEKERQKREARGVCYAYQRGECSRGASCKFSHDEKRSANTGWGPKESSPSWDHDRYNDPLQSCSKHRQSTSDQALRHRDEESKSKSKPMDKYGRSLRSERIEEFSDSRKKESDWRSKDHERRENEKLVEKKRSRTESKEERNQQTSEKLSRRHKSERHQKDDADRWGSEKQTIHGKDSSFHSRREKSEEHERRPHR